MNIYGLILVGSAKQELESLRGQSQAAEEFQAVYGKSQEGVLFQTAVSKGDLPLVAVMKFLSLNAPAGCVIVNLEYDKFRRRLDIWAHVPGSSNENPVSVSADFVQILTRSSLFQKVDLVEGVRDPSSGEYRFKVAAVAP